MSDVVSVQHAGQVFVSCYFCDRVGNIHWYCNNCQESLCDKCKESHRKTENHTVVPRTEEALRLPGITKIAGLCPIHETKEISTYCNECKVPCCVSCLAQRHKRHDFSPIEDVYLSAEKRLNYYIEQLNGDVRSKLDDKVKQAKDKNDEIIQSAQNVKEYINVFRKQLKDTVDTQCDNMIERVDLKPEFDLNEIVQKVDHEKEKVNKLVSDIREMIREGSLDIIKYTPPSLTSFVPNVNMPQPVHRMFIPNKEVVIPLKRRFGEIINFKFKVTKQNHFKVTEAKVTSIIPFNGGVRVIGEGNNTIHAYNESGEIVLSMILDEDGGIRDMVDRSTKHTRIMVTTDNKKVLITTEEPLSRSWQIFMRSSSFRLDRFTLIDTAPFCPEGICLTTNGEIVVCLNGQGDRNHVAVYSRNMFSTPKIKEIKGIDAQGRQLITDPYRIVENGEDLCVVNKEKNVVCVDKAGDVRWVYDGTQTQLEHKFGPHDICNDKHFNLLATDSNNHCVHYIHREGLLIKVILTQEQIGLQCHRRIGILEDVVWVGNYTGDIRSAKLDIESVSENECKKKSTDT